MSKLRKSASVICLAGLLGWCGVPDAMAGTIVAGSSLGEYTSLAQASAYDAVGMFSWDGGTASGTYIGDGWVLTAAHVAEASNSFTFSVGGVDYSSDQIVISDAWTGDVSRGGDMALIKLSTDVTNVSAAQLFDLSLLGVTDSGADDTDTGYNGIPGIDLQQQGFGRFGGFDPLGHGHHFGRFGGHGWFGGYHPQGPLTESELNALVGEVVTMVGYGMTGDGETGATEEGGVKIAGQNTIDWTGLSMFGYDENLLFVDFDNPDADEDDFRFRFDHFGSGAVDLEYLIASGDSGGGVFIEGEDGESYLLAVNSFLLAFDGGIDADYGDLAAFTSITGYLDWIYQVTGLGATLEVGDTTETASILIPEPASALLLGLTQTVVLGLLRRRER